MKELNLIPYSIREKQGKIIKIRNLAASLVILFCILFVGIYIPKMYLNILQNKETSMKAEIDKDAGIIKEAKNIEEDLKSYNEYTNKIDALSKQKVLVSNRLKEIGASIPKDVTATNINYSNGITSIIGVSKSYNSISEFAASLQMTKKYSQVRIMNETYDSNNKNYTFTINITY